MKKIIFSLFIFSITVLMGERAAADHQEDFPGIKTYENISVFHGKNVILSWIDNDMVSEKDILSSAGNERLEVLSEESKLGVREFSDGKGNRVILIEGTRETLFLTYVPGEIKRPYNLLEFKAEDGVISMEQIAHVTKLVKKSG